MVRTGVAFDWLPRYVEDESAAGMSMPCRRILTRVRPHNTVSVSRSLTPTTLPVKSSARAVEYATYPCPRKTRRGTSPGVTAPAVSDVSQIKPGRWPAPLADTALRAGHEVGHAIPAAMPWLLACPSGIRA
jgi:hypothetical protein